MDQLARCSWCGTDPLYVKYHDEEWGVPQHDDLLLFEMLNLEGAQAGLSWITVLKKRKRYKEVFDDFDPHKIIHYSDDKIHTLMNDAGIIRNRLKINAVISNARAFLNMQSKHGSFNTYIWSFVNGKSIDNKVKSMQDIPVKTDLSDKMSSQLKKDGFKFIGSTICYAYMQAVGMVNDHVTDCWRHHF